MNKYLTNTAIAMILAYTLVLPTSFAQVPAVAGTEVGGADTSSVAPSAPATSGTDIGGASTNTSGSSGSSAPATTGTDTGGANTNTSTATPPTVTGTNTGGATTATPTTPVTPPSGGGGGSVTYGGSSSGSIVPIYVVSTSTPTTTPFTSCPLITSYMKFGENNNSAEVIKLQAFLKTNENQNVDLNGIFDSKTEIAVKNFQRKYLTDVMGPWNATAPSGIVYITTKKKINELACNSSLTLNANELSIINSYVQNLNSSTTTVSPFDENSNGTSNGSLGPKAPTSTQIIGQNDNGTENTASVVNASIFQRIWNWIIHLFKR